mmetsp:Transcript_15081/g.27786  ORF Transcript_15081/g.27786 Transcript_15081/m.27786 type:complete len:293 (-) Transcript_15081:107-985(-)
MVSGEEGRDDAYAQVQAQAPEVEVEALAEQRVAGDANNMQKVGIFRRNSSKGLSHGSNDKHGRYAMTIRNSSLKSLARCSSSSTTFVSSCGKLSTGSRSTTKQHPSAPKKKQLTVVKHRLQKNYFALAREHRERMPYTRQLDTRHFQCENLKCVLCEEVKPIRVFFPCDHMCVCEGCLKEHNINSQHQSKPSRSEPWTSCPLCMSDIKLMLVYDYGNEIDVYWQWVYSSKPKLPARFLRKFKLAPSTTILGATQSALTEKCVSEEASDDRETKEPSRRHSMVDVARQSCSIQ